jgi:hypothetical protein
MIAGHGLRVRRGYTSIWKLTKQTYGVTKRLRAKTNPKAILAGDFAMFSQPRPKTNLKITDAFAKTNLPATYVHKKSTWFTRFLWPRSPDEIKQTHGGA